MAPTGDALMYDPCAMNEEVDATEPEPAKQRAGNEPEGPVMVVGGAGFIGCQTVRMLQERDVPVVVYDDLSTGHRDAVVAPLVVGSLSDREQLAQAFRDWHPRAVVHFAARCSVGESVADPALYYRENVQNTYKLLEEMRAAACKTIVFSSTCATYGVPDRTPITEDCPQRPINPYGRTKLHMEHMMSDYANAYGMRFAALRYFNAAGGSPDGALGEHHDPETHLIPLILQVAAGRREEILVFGDDYPTPDGTCVRDYIHVLDLADAHLRALSTLALGEREIVCNLGTGQGHSVQAVLEMARKVTGHPIPARVVERRAGDPPELVSGGHRAQEILGWRAQRSGLEDVVRDAWAFAESHPGGYSS